MEPTSKGGFINRLGNLVNIEKKGTEATKNKLMGSKTPISKNEVRTEIKHDFKQMAENYNDYKERRTTQVGPMGRRLDQDLMNHIKSTLIMAGNSFREELRPLAKDLKDLLVADDSSPRSFCTIESREKIVNFLKPYYPGEFEPAQTSKPPTRPLQEAPLSNVTNRGNEFKPNLTKIIENYNDFKNLRLKEGLGRNLILDFKTYNEIRSILKEGGNVHHKELEPIAKELRQKLAEIDGSPLMNRLTDNDIAVLRDFLKLYPEK